MKFRSVILFLAAFTLIAAGCVNREMTEEPEIGIYVLKGQESEDFAWVLLENGHQFQFNRHIATSYVPMGTYFVENDELILRADENEMYRFRIQGNTLIFESGKTAESLVEKGAVFELKID
ncbi:hypothetical protein [Proteiniclasticum sp.]|uniref:hypothetical protein n=1 Tax=Proteiniclasticum sp. TaxID=2053595 RepID=UPI0028965A57|nr:hypothetical protein [Proteiniclasticum sp.]